MEVQNAEMKLIKLMKDCCDILRYELYEHGSTNMGDCGSYYILSILSGINYCFFLSLHRESAVSMQAG